MLFESQIIKCVILIFLLTVSICCYAQQMVQTPKDLFIVCQKDEQFIGKPLKTLFMEIKPPIKLVLAEGGWVERAPRFTFFLTSKQVYDKYRRDDKFPIRITVFLKETFEWTWEGRNRTREHYLDWTKEDEEKYRNLTISAIRVSGEYDACYEHDVNL